MVFAYPLGPPTETTCRGNGPLLPPRPRLLPAQWPTTVPAISSFPPWEGMGWTPKPRFKNVLFCYRNLNGGMLLSLKKIFFFLRMKSGTYLYSLCFKVEFKTTEISGTATQTKSSSFIFVKWRGYNVNLSFRNYTWVNYFYVTCSEDKTFPSNRNVASTNLILLSIKSSLGFAGM